MTNEEIVQLVQLERAVERVGARLEALGESVQAARTSLAELDQRTTSQGERLAEMAGSVAEIKANVADERADASRLREVCFTVADRVVAGLLAPSRSFLVLVALLLVGLGLVTVGDLGELWHQVSPWAAGAELEDAGPPWDSDTVPIDAATDAAVVTP